ncbi:SBBP repeat-containing protein [Bacillus sp. SH8-8]|uniref:DUF7948 domain-containing protein n=1 Tax=Bacillus sp. SH8-8 TaxID=2217830 RepID=UPI0034D76DC3
MSTTEIKQTFVKNYGNLHFTFVPNVGQIDSRVQYYSQSAGKGFYFTPEEAVFSFIENTSLDWFKKGDVAQTGQDKVRQGIALALHFLDANPDVRIEGQSQSYGKINYFKGNDPAKWIRNLSTYKKVVYRDLWPGVDLVFYSRNGQLKYEFVVHPGANNKDIRLMYRGTNGLSLDDEGNLQIETPYGILIDERPLSYQEIEGKRIPVSSFYDLKQEESIYCFEIGQGYDSNYPLIIDPGLSYSTYLGGNDLDTGQSIFVDDCGHAYVTGVTTSNDFPTTPGAFQTTFTGTADVFVTKLNRTGSALIYSTFLGGNDIAGGFGIAVDSCGHAYVIGRTSSSDFPTTPGAFQTTFTGGIDAFVTKLNRTGSALVYSTFLGGNKETAGFGIAIDSCSHAYITGATTSSDFPTTPGAFQTTFTGGIDAFVTKLNQTGSALVYSTFIAGNKNTGGFGIAVGSCGHAYVTGRTTSSDFPTTSGAFQTTLKGESDNFVTKLNQTGSALVYSTFLGGTEGFDPVWAIAVDGCGYAYVTGSTTSSDFPTTPGAFQTNLKGESDAFVTKLNRIGSALVYSTFLGGSNEDEGFGIAVDSCGYAYVTGRTTSSDFPTTPGVFQKTLKGESDAFVTKIPPFYTKN